jgi:YHS domain-containing protein
MTNKCPVCQMDVDPKTAPARGTYRGKEYVFCSPECKQKFEANVEQYTRPEYASKQ